MPRLDRGSSSALLLTGAVLVVTASFAPTSGRAELLDQFIAPGVPGTDVQPNVTVLSRLRPEYQPLGAKFGNVTVRPELDETFGYDDNATATKRANGSALIDTNATLGANFDRSLINAYATLNVDDNEYLQQSRYSYTNWTANLGGNYTFDRDVLSFGYSHQNLNQTVQDLDVPQLAQSLAYRIDTLRVGYRFDFDRLFVLPALTVSNWNYDSGLTGGVIYAQSYRNRVVYNPTVTAGYQLGRATVVGVLRDAYAEFTGPLDNMPRQDFNDVSVLGGIDYEATGFLRYRLLAGFENRSFSSAAYKSISAPVVEASVIWNPTGLTTVTAEAARRIQDSSEQTTVALTESAVGLSVDHELRRNILLHGTTSYYIDQYGQHQGQQQLYTVGASATYLFTRNVQLTGGYAFTTRVSSGQTILNTNNPQFIGSSYNDNRVFVTLRLAL